MRFSKKTRSEQIKIVERALRKTFDERVWCRCGGRGSWTEQIDGTKMRTVRCPKHFDYTKEENK